MRSFHLITKGKFHQGANCFPIEARGRQCVHCCFMFFMTVHVCKHPKDFCEEDMQDILLCGSNFFCAIQNIYGVADDGFIGPANYKLMYKGHRVFLKHKVTYSGLVGDTIKFENSLVFSLRTAILESSVSYKYFVAAFCGVSVGIYCHENRFYVYDSHSRNDNGLNCVDGTAVLGVVLTLNDLCSHLRMLVMSLGHNVDNTQFDFHSYTIVKKMINQPSIGFEIFNSFPGFRVLKTLTRKRKNSESEDCQNVKKMDQGKSFAGYVDDRSVSDSDNDIIARFHKLVSVGPDYVCCCCTQTFFPNNMKCVNNIPPVQLSAMKKYCTEIYRVNNLNWLCKGCYYSLKNGKTPKFWLHNGLEFPAKPPELQLSDFEERLISPMLAFIQLLEVPRGRQLDIRGNIVNIPADMSSTVNVLPRLASEDGTILLKLKGKLLIKNHIPFENIRPNKVFAAAKWLLNNSSLFKKEGIVLNESWLSVPQEVSLADNTDTENVANCVDTGTTQENENDIWTEDENSNEKFTRKQVTNLQTADYKELNQVLSVASVETNSPVSLFLNIHSEILAFPTIFCGQPRVEKSKHVVPLNYREICSWELKNIDRRVANNITNIFFKLKKLQMGKLTFDVHNSRTNGKVSTPGELALGYDEQLTVQNNDYKVVNNLRCSPHYWERAKNDLLAMIRQIGIPTWYCSFSSAESNWVPLLQSLFKLANGTCLSNEDCERLSCQEKCKLIKGDPVTCARYFDFKGHTFLNEVLRHESMPVGKIVDYCYRVEFHPEGSPQIHMFAWIENAPVHGKDPDSTVIAFIDKYVTCSKDVSVPDLMKYQTHQHASPCRNKEKDVCRFQFPILPMPETVILYPLVEEQSDRYSEDTKRIFSLLNDLHKTDEDLSCEDFLKKLDMEYSDYCKVVRSTLVRPKLFLKRNVSECRINSYNSILLKSWMANMDLQYVLDPYSCVSYVMSFFSKEQRGLSKLLLDACSETQRSDSDTTEQVRLISSQLFSSVEICPQEAAFLILQMRFKESSRAVYLVDTNKPEERKSPQKSSSELKNHHKKSKDVEIDNTLKRYKRRPKSMEMVCYADFVSWYDLCAVKKQQQNKDDHDAELLQELPETEDELDQDDNIEKGETIGCGEVVMFPCGTQIKKRVCQRLIYSNIAPLESNREEHYRQKLMLYTHWRNEDDLIKGFANYEESFHSNNDQVRLNSATYVKCALDDELLLVSDDKHSTATSLNPESQQQDGEINSSRRKKRKKRRGCVSKGWKCKSARR